MVIVSGPFLVFSLNLTVLFSQLSARPNPISDQARFKVLRHKLNLISIGPFGNQVNAIVTLLDMKRTHAAGWC